MANLLQRVVQPLGSSRDAQISLDEYLEFFQYGGLNYPAFMQQTLQGNEEAATDGSFEGLVRSAFKGNGIVFACMLARMKVFSEARFQYRARENGRPGKLFGTKALSVLERPWVGGTTGDLLTRAMQDTDLAGNFFCTPRMGRTQKRLARMRPDWVTIILGSHEDPDVEQGDLDAEVLGYIYLPGGPGSGNPPELLLAEQVAHFAPIPDPIAWYRGQSWVTPIMREYLSDTAMTAHKMKFLERGATPNMVVTMDPSIKKEAFKEWVQMFKDKHEGVVNAYRTLYLGAGASILPVGKDFQQMEFAVTQSVGEVRICAASGVPPVLVGVTEGIKSATYSNYQSAKRYFADATLRPLWRNFASSMEVIIGAPENAELWYDDRDIPFLYEDEKDVAAIAQRRASTIASLVNSGYTPDSVVNAVISDDFELLKHTGLFSVQLLPPGITNTGGIISGGQAGDDAPDANDPSPKKKKKTDESKSSSNGHASRSEALMLLGSIAENRRTAQPPPAPSVDVHIHEGAFRSDPQIAVDARTVIEDGAVRVDAPVNVEPEFVLRDGAIQVVNPVTIKEGAVKVNVPVNIEEGAVQVPVVVEPTTVDAPVTVVVPETSKPERSGKKVYERDERGLISSVTEIPLDEIEERKAEPDEQ